MRLIKMLGPAAIAAVAAMAFLGASSASAGNTALCLNNTAQLTIASCEFVKDIHFASIGHVVLLGSANIECESLITGTTGNSLVTGGPVVFAATIIYFNCLGGCKAEVVKQGEVSILKTAVELGEVTGKGFIVKVTCFGLNCDYDATGLVGHAHQFGGKTHVTFTKSTVNVLEKLGGFITCPSTGALDALYASLKTIFIRA